MTWATLIRRVLAGRRRRSLLSIFSVALGVAVFVAVSIGSRNLSTAVRNTAIPVDESVVNLQPVGTFEATAPAGAVDALRGLEGVLSVHSSLQVDARSSAGPDAASVPIRLQAADGVGPDLGDGELRVPAPLAEQLGVEPGSPLILETSTGTHRGTVAGTPASSSDIAAFIVQASRTTVEDWSGLPGRITSVFVVLEPGTERDAWIRSHQDELAGLVPLSAGLGSRAEEFFRSVEDSIAPLAAAALFVASYLIFLTSTRATREQSRTYATMRVGGASSRQIGAVVVVEAATIAAIGTVAGLALGVLGGGFVAEVMRQIFRFDIVRTATTVPGDIVLTAVALGVLVPVAASLLPAWRAARVDPVEGLRAGANLGTERASPVRALAGGGLLAVGLVALPLAPEELSWLPTLLSLTGAALLLPALAQPAGAGAARLLARLSPGSGELAAQDLARRPGQSASTAALLAVTLAVAVMVGTISESTRPGFHRVLDAHYGTDFRASTTTNQSGVVTDRQASDRRPLSAEEVAAIRALPVVADATPQTYGRIRIGTGDAGVRPLLVIDPDSYFRVADLAWSSRTDAEAAVGDLQAGGHVALATQIAEDAGVEPGDMLTLASPDGPVTLEVAGTFHALGFGETASVVVSSADAARHFGHLGATNLLIDLAPGGGSLDAQLAAAGLPDLFLVPNEVIHRQIAAQFDGITGLVSVLLVVTASVGILGLANTLAIDTMDRRREIGILRAVGASPRDIRTFVLARSVVLTGTAGVGAAVLGGLLGAATVAPNESNLGMAATYRFPTGVTVAVVVVAVVVGVCASIRPARRATRLQPAVVLQQTATT